MRGPAGLLHLDDLVVDLRVAAGEEGAAVDHHVDLVGAELDGLAHVGELDRERRLAGRERRRHRRHLHAGAVEPRLRGGDEVRVDADGGNGRYGRIDRVGPQRLRAEGGDLAGRVGALERRQVHHPHGEVVRLQLRVLLDRALGERGGALLERDGVDGADARQPRLERELESARQCGRLGHGAKCTPTGMELVRGGMITRMKWRGRGGGGRIEDRRGAGGLGGGGIPPADGQGGRRRLGLIIPLVLFLLFGGLPGGAAASASIPAPALCPRLRSRRRPSCRRRLRTIRPSSSTSSPATSTRPGRRSSPRAGRPTSRRSSSSTTTRSARPAVMRPRPSARSTARTTARSTSTFRS